MPSKSFVKVVGLLISLLSLGPASIYFLYTDGRAGLESRVELAFHRNARFVFMAWNRHQLIPRPCSRTGRGSGCAPLASGLSPGRS